MARFNSYIRTALALLVAFTSISVSAQSRTTTEDYSLTGRHRIAYHYGTLITGKEHNNGVVRLFRKHTIPVVSIDYSFYIDRHWSIGADAAVYLPNEYRLKAPKGYAIIEGEDGNRNITAGSFMATGAYTHTAGPVELSYILGIGFTEFTAKQDYFYLMNPETEDTYTMRLKGKSGFFFTMAPQVRVSRHLSRTLSIFLEARYNILTGKSSMELYAAPNVRDRETTPMTMRKLTVSLPNSFNINFGFTLRFGTIK